MYADMTMTWQKTRLYLLLFLSLAHNLRAKLSSYNNIRVMSRPLHPFIITFARIAVKYKMYCINQWTIHCNHCNNPVQSHRNCTLRLIFVFITTLLDFSFSLGKEKRMIYLPSLAIKNLQDSSVNRKNQLREYDLKKEL